MNTTNDLSGSSSPTIISYLIRGQGGHVGGRRAIFLNADELLRSKELNKIKSIYINILCDITAYDPGHVKKFSELEKKLYNHIIELENSNKVSQKKHSCFVEKEKNNKTNTGYTKIKNGLIDETIKKGKKKNLKYFTAHF